jgi:DNA invertase Pin-like site-specific DNA recombinase
MIGSGHPRVLVRLRTLDSYTGQRVLQQHSNAHVSLSQKMPQNNKSHDLVSEAFLRQDDGMNAMAATTTAVQLGYVRVSTGHQSLDQQVDALTAAGVDPNRVYSDKLSGTSTREQRPGLAALLDYARPGDAIVVAGIDRLGRNAAEVMATIWDLRDRNIVLRSLREGIDTSNATGRMVAGVLASLAEVELELGRERRTAAREARRSRGRSIGRPKALDRSKAALAQRMHASGESASTIAATLGVSRATVYRVLAQQTNSDD